MDIDTQQNVLMLKLQLCLHRNIWKDKEVTKPTSMTSQEVEEGTKGEL